MVSLAWRWREKDDDGDEDSDSRRWGCGVEVSRRFWGLKVRTW